MAASATTVAADLLARIGVVPVVGPSLGGVLSAARPPEVAAALLLLAALALALARLAAAAQRASDDLDKIPGPWRSAVPVLGNVPECLRHDFHRVILNWCDQFGGPGGGGGKSKGGDNGNGNGNGNGNSNGNGNGNGGGNGGNGGQGGIVRIKFLWRDTLLVTDPQALGVIMGRGDGALDKAALAYAPINGMCDPHRSPNLLTSPADDAWKVIRKAVAVSFSFQNIKRKFPVVLSRVNELCGRLAALGPDASVDVDQAALRVTLDVIGLAGFGHDYASVRQDTPAYDHLLRVLPRCFTEVMLRVANPLRPVFPRWFKNGPKGEIAFKMFQKEMGMLLHQMKERGPPDDDDHDIAAQLYRVMAEHPEVSEARVLSEIGILFVEGFETTGHTTSWTLFNIATHPEAQRRIAEELDSLGLLWKAGAPPPRELELDDLKRLPFLSACTKEAMRMFPVVSIMAR